MMETYPLRLAMAKEKKIGVAPWWIGLTYSITASVVPFVIGAVVAALIGSYVLGIPGDGVAGSPIVALIGTLIGFCLLWIGIRSAARYIRKTYEIQNALEIVLWGLVFFTGSLSYSQMQI